MLRRLNVRTRLVALIALQLVLLLAVVVPEGLQRQDRVEYLAPVGAGLLVALALALAVVRSITRPLRELTDAADHLAEERLPQLVDALRHPADDDAQYLTATLEPIRVRSDDELGRLARAFNSVQSVAFAVASEQATLLPQGISDLYVNLARRNQSLIDRQIQLLDRLEAGELDAEVLEHLYQLDHLATRMRRNAESLLILAGSEPGNRRSEPVPLVDVVRAAVSEVEEYERVDLGALAAATLHGRAVRDVAHLLAELIENATQFSPPETQVRVDGARTGGSYQIVVTDRGMGITQDKLDELNAVLRDPPVTGLALGHALGCLVAARLAARHGITVRLRPVDHEGVAAYVVLPRDLLIDDVAEPIGAPMPETVLSLPATDEWPAHWEPEEPPTAEPADVPAPPRERIEPPPLPARLSDVLATPASFDESVQALLDGERGPSLVEPPVPVQVDRAAIDALDDARATLRRRIPGATTQAPASRPDGVPRRGPDEVRALLSRYRSGLQAGRVTDVQADQERT